MSATNFNTRNDTFRKLIGNGLTYSIPRFQRDYSWGEEEWEDLWLDILGVVNAADEPAHYMGYLVLQSDNEKTFDVIDGQQRLTTLSLIVLAAMKNLGKYVDDTEEGRRNQQRLEQLRQTYIGYLDPVTLVSKAKLTLNRNNDDYYQTYIIPLGTLPQRGFKASEHLLRKAFEWYEQQIGKYAEKQSVPGTALAKLVETMSDKLFFTVISVNDELNAYKVFETLNARGVRLSSTDLLKNYLFSVLDKSGQHRHEMDKLERRWESIVGRLRSESFPDFLRVHWNSRHSFVRHNDLFKTIRKNIQNREDVFELLRAMEEDADTYVAITDPQQSNWSPVLKHSATELHMFGVKQPYALLLAAKQKYSEADFTTLLRACVVISFRYNVIGNQPANEQERIYNEEAEKVSKGEHALPATLRALRHIYPSDQEFRAAFAEKIIRTAQRRNNKVVRYILGMLEKQYSGNDLELDNDTYNIEHILPQNPEAGWEMFPEDVDVYTYRLGNMTLLHTAKNRALGNLAWPEKREAYRTSNIGLTKKLADDYSEWNPESLAARQNWMASQATGIWRVSQFT